MGTVNGLPAHILLVHAIVVLLPLAALLLVLTRSWSGGHAPGSTPARRTLCATVVGAYPIPVVGLPVTAFGAPGSRLAAAVDADVRAARRRGLTVSWIQQLKSRASACVARSQHTPTACRNRHHRNKSIPYDRNVDGERPAATSSRKNTATGTTTAPSRRAALRNQTIDLEPTS